MNWKKRVLEAKKTGFTESDKKDANYWQTCAVGEALELSNHTQIEAKREADACGLLHEGLIFADAVEKDDVESAKKLLHTIRKNAGCA